MHNKGFRIVFETYEIDNPQTIISSTIVMNDVISKPTNCLDISMEHEKQIELLQATLDKIISEKAKLLNKDEHVFPQCSGTIIKRGTRTSIFNDIFTDHTVKIQRLSCVSCDYEPPATIMSLFGGALSGALLKVQSEVTIQPNRFEAVER